MCGIIAIAGNKADRLNDSLIGDMLSCLSKRGPDEQGFVKIEDCVLGQTRLSIVDIAGGHQPMRDNKNPFTIVFNGEIYGYKEIRKKLEERGHVFGTHSDTEVILKAYAEYGKECIEHLDGMFAFALWDENKKELFIARDRLGKKPLYYAFINNSFFGASEIKALFKTGLIKGEIDVGALDDYLRLVYVPPNKTIYSNIHTLPPAHAGIVKDGKIEIWQYWKLLKKETTISYEDAKREIKKLFAESVRKRMVADVEIGSLLSGGVDSTIVTQQAQEYSKTPIKTFSVGFGSYKSELPYAEEASKQIKTEHYAINIEAKDMHELRSVIEYFDEPHADSSDFPQHLVSKLAASKVKVALSGDGADELLMGYGWYQKYWHTPVYKRIFETPFSSYKKTVEVFSTKERNNLLKKKTKRNASFEEKVAKSSKDGFDQINRHNLLVYLPGQLLTKVDRTSMMHSLEIRSPFLDTALVEFIYNLPIEYKVSKTQNKIILKDILSEVFSKEFVYRRKQGFGAPLRDWVQDPAVQQELKRVVEAENHPLYKYLDRKAVKRIVSGNSEQKNWSILCLALWFESHSTYHE